MSNKLLITSIIFVTGILMFHGCKKDRTTVYVNNAQVNNPPGKVTTSYPVSIMSSWAKAAPSKQVFVLNPAIGKWITGAKGCRFYFPANSLLDQSNNPVTGNVDIELREYMSKADMLFSGVTVTSGKQLLESGGMFYLMARKNGAELHLKDNVGFQMEIPQSNATDDPMDIWIGEPNGMDSLNKVNWLKKDTVAIVPLKDSGQQAKKYFHNFDYFKFGYCNIDREWGKFKNLVKKFRVKLPDNCNDTNSTALLLFKNYNSCAWCYWLVAEKMISTSYGLPSGEIAKVLVYKKTGKEEDDLEYAVKEFIFKDDTQVDFTTLTKCTNNELEAIIKAL